MYTEKHKPDKTEQDRKRGQKNKIADIARHKFRIWTKNVHPETQYVRIVKTKDTSRKHVGSNNENDKNLKKLVNSKRPREVIPTSQWEKLPEQKILNRPSKPFYPHIKKMTVPRKK